MSFHDAKKEKGKVVARTGISRLVADVESGEIKRTRYVMNEILTWHYAILAHYSTMAHYRGETIDQFLKTLPEVDETDETDYNIGVEWGKKVRPEVLHQAYFYGKVGALIETTDQLRGGAFDEINRAIEDRKLVNALRVIRHLPDKKK